MVEKGNFLQIPLKKLKKMSGNSHNKTHGIPYLETPKSLSSTHKETSLLVSMEW
jgi:hypothetical protein